MMRRTLAAISVCVCMVGSSALAADLPRRAAPPVFAPAPPIFTWSGFYVGGYAGGSFEGNVGLTNAVGSNSAKREGFTGGGLVGFNYQVGRVVLGIEGDIGYDGERARKSFVFPGPPAFLVNETERSSGVVGRVRGRVGYAIGNMFLGETLLYVAGGGSFLREQFSFAALGAIANSRKDRSGFNVGGGVEVAWGPNWIGRLEYIYDDFGRENYLAPPLGLPFKASLTDNTVRAALIYKF